MVVDYKDTSYHLSDVSQLLRNCCVAVCSEHVQVLYICSGELGQRAFIQGLLFDFLAPVLPFPPSYLDRSTQQILNDSRRYIA